MSGGHGPEPEPARQSPSPDDQARVIAKRPGMYLGEASYERAIGFLHGLAYLASQRRSAPSEDGMAHDGEFMQDSATELLGRVSAVRRDPGLDERDAILALEPLLAEALTALQEPDAT